MPLGRRIGESFEQLQLRGVNDLDLPSVRRSGPWIIEGRESRRIDTRPWCRLLGEGDVGDLALEVGG
jgi:hypothetical protein